MKSKFKFYISQLVLLFVFIACDKEFPEPKVIQFEKQQVVANYDWKIISPNGNSLNFITKYNKTIFIYHWSVNDKNNIASLKKLEDFYNAYKTKIEFIAIAKDKQPDVRAFLDKSNYYFPVCYSLSIAPKPIENKVAKTYLISKKGRILIEHEGSANWNSDEVRKIIDGLLKQ